MKIVSMTSSEIAMGLRLGGLKECHIIDNPEECEDLLIELSQDTDTGILLVDDGIARIHHRLIDQIRASKKTFPIIVEIQTTAKTEAGEGIDPLKDLIKRAIGVDISADKDQEDQAAAPKLQK